VASLDFCIQFVERTRRVLRLFQNGLDPECILTDVGLRDAHLANFAETEPHPHGKDQVLTFQVKILSALVFTPR
jgi:hypothetical protein